MAGVCCLNMNKWLWSHLINVWQQAISHPSNCVWPLRDRGRTQSGRRSSEWHQAIGKTSERVQMSPWIFWRCHVVGHIVGHTPDSEGSLRGRRVLAKDKEALCGHFIFKKCLFWLDADAFTQTSLFSLKRDSWKNVPKHGRNTRKAEQSSGSLCTTPFFFFFF